MKRNKSILGVDIGVKKTKVVQLAFSGKAQPELVTCELLDTGLGDESFQANMKAFLSDSKLKNSLAAVTFEDPSLVIRRFELPKMPDLDLIEALKWNLRDHIDSDVEHYTIKHSKISEIEEGDLIKTEIVVYAAKKSAILDYKLRIEQTGLLVFMIEPSAVTLASALDRFIPDESRYIAGVDVGHHQTKFYVVGNRSFIFSRPVPGVNYEVYEKSPDDFPQKLAIEIQKSIDTFQVNFRMQDIRHICLSGGGALIENLPEYLRKNMGLEVDTLNPFTSVLMGTSSTTLRPELFGQAVSLAFLQP